MESIGDDLLTEILIRLPDSRQALRCAAVCKGWSALICGDQFARWFVAHHRGLDDSDFSVAVLPLLLGFHRMLIMKNYLSFLPWENLVIRAYCDDLLLVSRVDGENRRLSLCICNPVTKKYWCGIPEPPDFISGDLFKLLFTRRRGSDNRVDHDYHVTLFSCCDHRVGEMCITDFSCKTGQWSSPTMVSLPRDCHFYFHALLFREPVTCGDGLVYWLGGEGVIAFDPSAAASPYPQRGFRAIPLPSKTSGKPYNVIKMRLGTYRGRLRATYINASALRVWELNHVSSCWSLVHDVALGLSTRECISVLALHPGDPNAVFLRMSTKEMLQYDMSSRTSQTLGKLPEDSFLFSVYPLCSIWPTPVPSLESDVASVAGNDVPATTESFCQKVCDLRMKCILWILCILVGITISFMIFIYFYSML